MPDEVDDRGVDLGRPLLQRLRFGIGTRLFLGGGLGRPGNAARKQTRLRFPNMVMALVALLALLLLAVTLQDAFEVMLLPRRVMRRLRFVSLFYRLTWFVWSALAYRLPRDGQREHD